MPITKRFGDKVKANEERLFIGREKERKLFAQFLKETRSQSILNISGLGGIGKSSLLDQFQRMAANEGALFFLIDSRDFPHTPKDFTYFLAELLHIFIAPNTPYMKILQTCISHLDKLSQGQTVVFAFDTYENMLTLDRWLREFFISELPQNLILIISGRTSLLKVWQSYPHWRELVQPITLKPLSFHEVKHFAHRFGIKTPQLQRSIFSLTQGHPLTLTLILEINTKEEAGADLMNRLRKSLNRIIYEWLREIHHEKIRRMVEAASIVRNFDQNLLEHMIEEAISPEEFYQMTNLSFVRESNTGWNIHDILQKNLSKEIRIRTPEHYKTLWKRSIFYYYKRLLRLSIDDNRANWMEDLLFVLGDSMLRAIFFEERSEGHFFGEQASATNYNEVKQFLDNLIQRYEHLNVNVEFLDAIKEEEYVHQMPAEYFKREVELLATEQLMQLGMEAFHLIRNDAGEAVGLIVNVPINEQTIAYLQRSPVATGYFSQLSKQGLEEYAVPAPGRSGCFLRLIGFQDDNDTSQRTALMHYLLSLWLREPRSVVTTAFPLYIDILERIGFEKVPGVMHSHYGSNFLAPTFVLDLRKERFLDFLDRRIAEAGVSVTTMLTDGLFNLTPREREVTQLVIECLTNTEIAEHMDITEITVKKHLSNVFEKAMVSNRMELLKKVYDTVLTS